MAFHNGGTARDREMGRMKARRVREETTAILETVNRNLERYYGKTKMPRCHDPVEVFVRTILSQNTNDHNSGRAYDELRTRYKTWEDVAGATPQDLQDVLKIGGLARRKSVVILHILHRLLSRGEISLDYIREMDAEAAEKELLSFPGVGYKTARCVLLFAFGKDVFPIDTHIYRVLTRLGILPAGITRDAASVVLKDKIPRGKSYSLHIHLIALGREICHPRKPSCQVCPLRKLCAFAAQGS